MLKIVAINIIVMMITDSVFSAMSPYLWLGDVFTKNKFMVDLYLVNSTFFYMANTFFACLILYLIYNFGLDGTGRISSKSQAGSEDESEEEHKSPHRNARQSPYLDASIVN